MGVSLLQWLGSGTVVAGTASLGGKMAERFHKRPQELRELAGLLRQLAAEISYARVPLTEALERIGRFAPRASPVRAVLAEAGERLQTPGITLEEAWNGALQSRFANTSLSAEDRLILAALGETLGQSGAAEQAGLLAAAVAQLVDREREAVRDRDRYARVYLTVGVLVGALIVVLLI
ncbi:MAG: stage III sporulation protein AB [Firmicutes bacterium]|nr:stage III sporulation protein AB [Bacillota bacterium]